MEGRRMSSVPSPHVSKRLCLAIVVFVGVICTSLGYVLGNMARMEARRSSDLITSNLTTATDLLYRKAKRISPKTIHINNPEKISAKLIEIFHSDCADCGTMKNYNVHDYIKTIVHFEAAKFIRAIHNASLFIETLR
ncbi:hypothetical protein JYU34_018351 [Plutella xylostella]|uniref:Uncharacterized protein n=1 Tax=Plutella xylostella TaxID=51655 RepID=A0ABQ7PXL5_PLUXY|nr:hypothetical protein JYU34_018351 [Plutella xylostella]